MGKLYGLSTPKSFLRMLSHEIDVNPRSVNLNKHHTL